jgi:hypothetical protein
MRTTALNAASINHILIINVHWCIARTKDHKMLISSVKMSGYMAKLSPGTTFAIY